MKKNVVRKEPPRHFILRERENDHSLNSTNSANCVIPKRVVDRLDAVPGFGWCERQLKKIRVGGCGQSNAGGGREEKDDVPHTYIYVRTHTTFASSAIPGTFFLKLAVVSRRGDYKAPRFFSPFPPSSPIPVRPDAIHNTCIPYLFRT